MYRIGEFARLGMVSIRTLRHYDELGLLRPAHVDPNTGYRAYEARQLGRLNRLVALRDLGFGLKEAERLLQNVSASELRGMLLLRRAELEQRMAEDCTRLARVEVRLRAIEEEDDMPEDVSLKSLPAQRVAAIARPAPGFGHENLSRLLQAAFRDLVQALNETGVQARRPYFTCYTGDPEAGTLVAYACAPVSDDVERIQEPAHILLVPAVSQAAVMVREGTAAEIYTNSRVYVELAKWLEAHDYVPAGAGRDVFVGDRKAGPNEPTVFEIQLPVRRPHERVPDLEPKTVTPPRLSRSGPGSSPRSRPPPERRAP
jgi:DNA-binding transcriptional MerR regulator